MVETGASGIYTITAPSGGQYVGSAVNFGKRWGNHIRDLRKGIHKNSPLQRAYLKYGEQGLVFKKLLICAPKNLIMYEQRAIDVLKPTYNLCPIAGNCLGVKRSPLSEERKAKISAALCGRKPSQETRDKLSAAKRGRPRSPETIEKMREAMKGRRPSQATIDASRLAKIGKKHSAEHRAKISAAGVGRKWSPETREKLIPILKARGVSPQCQLASIRSHTGSKMSEETRAKMSETHSKRNAERRRAKRLAAEAK